MSNQPPSNSDNSGWYVPVERPYPTLPNYQEFENMTEPFFSVQITDALHNLWTELPTIYAQSLRMAGEDVVWLSRLTSGVRCPNWNETSNADSISKCPICYGTGWVGGYQNARRIRVSFNPGKQDVEIQQIGLTVTQTPSAWTISTVPLIKAFDILVNYANERYIVDSVTYGEKQGRRMYQDMSLSRIDRFDVNYEIPVPGINGQLEKDFMAQLEINIPMTAPTVANFIGTVIIQNTNWEGIP